MAGKTSRTSNTGTSGSSGKSASGKNASGKAGKEKRSNKPSYDYPERFEKDGIEVLSRSSPKPRRHDIEIASANIGKATKLLAKDLARLITISALSTNRGFELLYHFHIEGAILTLKTEVAKRDASMDSIASILPAAELIEHEIEELLGVTFPGNPRKTNFILPEDWPKDKKPLKKDDETLSRMMIPLAGRGQWRLEK